MTYEVKPAKKQMSFNVSQKTRQTLETLAAFLGISMTDVLEMAIDELNESIVQQRATDDATGGA